ncbi:MAG: hypothetical protein DSY76_00675 [Bacteroidetes bacterium]|nr:MAG: hypothetical protein DSY76_00675 [Bacteroidota bacterium]
MRFHQLIEVGLLLLLLLAIIYIWQQYKTIKKLNKLRKDSRRIKERYMEFIELLPLTVIELGPEGKITFLNSVGYDMLEITNYDIEQGVLLNEMILKDQQQQFTEDFLYVLEGGLNKGQEYVLRSKSGVRYSIIIYFSRIINNRVTEGVRGVILDVSSIKELERKSFQVVIDTEERERKRFSEDLHDGLGPMLSTIKLYINQMNKSIVSDKERMELLDFTNDLIDEAINSTRTIANNILPSSIGDNGLWSAITAFCNNIEQTGTIRFVLVNNTDLHFSKNVENSIYRIIIELVNNTIKHAQAEQINISFELENETVKIEYSDDGVGINYELGKGLGLKNIKNRCKSLNGQYRIYNEDGMRFELIIPIVEIIE